MHGCHAVLCQPAGNAPDAQQQQTEPAQFVGASGIQIQQLHHDLQGQYDHHSHQQAQALQDVVLALHATQQYAHLEVSVVTSFSITLCV